MFDLSPAEIAAVLLSLKVSLWAVGISLPFGIATAWVLARLEFPGKTLLDALIHWRQILIRQILQLTLNHPYHFTVLRRVGIEIHP